MPWGSRITTGKLVSKLATLDTDEGIRIEGAGQKMYINRNASGVFIVQYVTDFYYFDSTKQVLNAIRSRLGSRYAVWVY